MSRICVVVGEETRCEGRENWSDLRMVWGPKCQGHGVGLVFLSMCLVVPFVAKLSRLWAVGAHSG